MNSSKGRGGIICALVEDSDMKKGGDGKRGFAHMTRRDFSAGLLSGAGLAAARPLGAVDRGVVSLREASHYQVLVKETGDDD